MNNEDSNLALSAISHAALMVQETWRMVAFAHEDVANELKRPFMMLKPRIFIDGNQWCALYGENIQDGVAGFGDSPELAAKDFDLAWVKNLMRC